MYSATFFAMSEAIVPLRIAGRMFGLSSKQWKSPDGIEPSITSRSCCHEARALRSRCEALSVLSESCSQSMLREVSSTRSTSGLTI